jgi:hypothetical protein
MKTPEDVGAHPAATKAMKGISHGLAMSHISSIATELAMI